VEPVLTRKTQFCSQPSTGTAETAANNAKSMKLWFSFKKSLYHFFESCTSLFKVSTFLFQRESDSEGETTPQNVLFFGETYRPMKTCKAGQSAQTSL
jgi:hypothetical protein